MRRAPLAWTLAALVAAVLASPARAAYPGVNGAVAYRDFDTGDLFTVGPDGLNPTDLHVAGFQPVYSPDGKRLAFVQNGHLMVAAADGTGAFQVPADDSALGGAESPSWSPDGRQIVLARPVDEGSANIDVANVAARTETVFRAAVGNPDPDPSWSPRGSVIAYAAGGDIFTIGTDGGGNTNITAADPNDYSSPDWSPDGTQIAASADVLDGEFTFPSIEVMNADGSAPHSVASPPNGGETRPAWSPDGQVIAYVDSGSDSGGSFAHIHFVTVGTGEDSQTDGNGFEPTWQPIDTVPPTVTLRVPAQGARYAHNAHVVSDYICNDPPPGAQVIVQCSGTVRAGAAVPTSAPGTHTFTVTARDRMGNRTVVTHTYTVLPPPPVTRILTGPPSQTRSRTATFAFTATNGPVTFECEIDGGGFGPCSGAGTDKISGLSLGVHHFRVRARNAGGLDQHPPEWNWKVLPKRLSKRTSVFSTFERHIFPREFVLFRSVIARDVPAGTRISAACRGRGCPQPRRRTWLVRKARDKVRLTSWIRHHELRPTAAVFVELTKPGFVGKGKLYCVRHHRRVRIVAYTVGQQRPACR